MQATDGAWCSPCSSNGKYTRLRNFATPRRTYVVCVHRFAIRASSLSAASGALPRPARKHDALLRRPPRPDYCCFRAALIPTAVEHFRRFGHMRRVDLHVRMSPLLLSTWARWLGLGTNCGRHIIIREVRAARDCKSTAGHVGLDLAVQADASRGAGTSLAQRHWECQMTSAADMVG